MTFPHQHLVSSVIYSSYDFKKPSTYICIQVDIALYVKCVRFNV